MSDVKKIISILKRKYPLSKTTLRYRNPFQLLIATILSAQCTDKRVNSITPKLFKAYPNPKTFAHAALKDIEKIIRPTGFYRNKAKVIKNLSKVLIEKYGGSVPRTMEELTKLPGVGRKTANIILGYGFGKSEGIAVDTHVRRLSFRLGLTKSRNPNKIEKDLMKQIPKRYWTKINSMFVAHGRTICKSRVPYCSRCSLEKMCPKISVRRRR